MTGRGTSSRGRGGKFKKYTRGGGHHFSRDLQPLDKDGNAVSMWSADAQNKDSEDDDDSEEESEEEDSEEEESDSDEEDGDEKADGAAKADASREDRRAQKKARKEAAIAKQKAKNVEVGDMPSSDEESEEDEDDDMPANPNHSKAARKQAAKPVGSEVDEITEGVKNMKTPTRKEREAAEAAAEKEKYMKLHAQGKTDEAKSDLARLKVIREQRAAEAARRQAEKEEKEAKEKERRAEIEAKEAKKREAAAGPKKGGKKK